jgi:hypothetical protein
MSVDTSDDRESTGEERDKPQQYDWQPGLHSLSTPQW